MSGHRKAALALHALVPEDRESVLADLPEADRHILRGYLGELEELGFDPAAIGIALADRQAHLPRDVVDAADAADVLRVVRDEPVSFLSALLDAGPWRWETALLAALPGHVRVRLETQRSRRAGAASSSARAAFVVGAVAQALGAQGAGVPRKPGLVARMRKWVASWTR